jgi:predicted metal-dependent hydrolase
MTDLPVDIIRSRRRKRTAQAYVASGRLRVLVPEGLDPEEESRLVASMVARMSRKVSAREVDLTGRTRELARKYGLPLPTTITWSGRQMRRWGSCTPSEGRIRVSNRLATMPGWVLDSVIVHELAHLEEANHGPRFQALVGRYELSERAKGYLMAKTEEQIAS